MPPGTHITWQAEVHDDEDGQGRTRTGKGKGIVQTGATGIGKGLQANGLRAWCAPLSVCASGPLALLPSRLVHVRSHANPVRRVVSRQAGRLTFGPLPSYAQPDDDSATASTSTTASPVGGLVPAMDAMDATDGAARTNGKRGRSKRQPQAPKQSVSAFGIFSKHVHKQVKEPRRADPRGTCPPNFLIICDCTGGPSAAQLMAEYPDMSAQERTANIAERWKQLPQEYRAQFEAAAAADTARYLAELQLYQQQQQQRDDHAINGHVRRRMPRRRRSAGC